LNTILTKAGERESVKEGEKGEEEKKRKIAIFYPYLFDECISSCLNQNWILDVFKCFGHATGGIRTEELKGVASTCSVTCFFPAPDRNA